MLRVTERDNPLSKPIIELNGAPPPVKSLFEVIAPFTVALTEAENARLAQCDARIDQGLVKIWYYYLDVGAALMTVWNERLYREKYGTFEEYCRAKSAFHRAHCYRLMAAAQIVKHLSPIGDILPKTEA